MASGDDFFEQMQPQIENCNEMLENCIRNARFISGMKEIKSTDLAEIVKCREILRDSARLIDEINEELLMEAKLEEKNAIVLELQSRLAERDARLAERDTLILELQNRLVEAEKNRKNLHDIIQELKGNIRVFCRVRPSLSARIDTKFISFSKSTEENSQRILLSQNGKEHSFSFDKVFMPDASQEDVFVEISQLVQSALDGYKVCVFAYGQAGSGKTYTMMGKLGGPPEHKGLIPRALEQIFRARSILQAQGWKYDMKVFVLEIYNESIHDLLATSDASQTETRMDVWDDANGNSYVPGLTVVDVHDTSEVLFLLDQASERRSVYKTHMNEQSSRSHFVFTLRIRASNESTNEHVEGILNLIDLAGSDRLSVESTPNLAKKTKAINKSLSALKDVILALVNKENFVPYRNSTLTRLLKPCLGGAAKTLMFVNLSPEPSSASESLDSLRFATQVNACEVGRPRRQI